MGEHEMEILRKIRKMTHEMLALADEGSLETEDASRAILYGILRDASYRLRKLADRELDRGGDAGAAMAQGAGQDDS
jgi:hypothetical protein